jgi:CRISPR-associated exonuclease Cas4
MNLILTVTDLKQYCYCPRILFYMRCLPGVRPLTVKMEEGKQAHEREEEREERRQLRAYGFSQGERHFAVSLFSATLGMTALIDLVILRPDGKAQAVPVDYKLSRMVGPHVKMQLACYGLMLEEETGLPVPYGFVYLIQERRAEKVQLTPSLRIQTCTTLTAMRTLIESETMPPPTSRVAYCVNCEFRRFCNDVL